MMGFSLLIDLLYTHEPQIERRRSRDEGVFKETVDFGFQTFNNFFATYFFVWRCLILNMVDLLERKFACQDDISFLLIYIHSCFSRKLLFYLFIIYFLVY